MAALNAALAGFDAVLKVKRYIGGVVCVGQIFEHGLGGSQGQLGVDGVVLRLGLLGAQANARDFGHKNQLIGLKRRGHRGRHLFHGQVKGFARGGEAKRGDEHHGAGLQTLRNTGYIHFAHQARVLEVHPIENTHGACGNEVARDHTHRSAGHGGIG